MSNNPNRNIETFCCTGCSKNFKSEHYRKYCSIACSMWDKLDVSKKGCWLWGGKVKKGYSLIRFGSREYPAHRVCFAEMNGFKSVDDFGTIKNICGYTNCVRGDHWQLKNHQSLSSEST